MALELTDVFRAASLIQWGLQPRVRPVQNTEYRELVREYLNRSEFRDVVAEMSDGLGLYVLNVSEHGIVLSPREGSVFWMRASEFRPGSKTADIRLLDGLIQITIAATVYPRARDLEDDVNRPRLPVTVDEIDDALRNICASLKIEFERVDPNMDDVRTGLYDAWRVYDNALSSRETKDGRESHFSTLRIIKYNLERLKDNGCFTETRYAGKEAWQPTRRYNVLVQELAASRLYDEVMHIKNGKNPDLMPDDDNFADAPATQPAATHENADDPDAWGSQFRDSSVELDEHGDAIIRNSDLDHLEDDSDLDSEDDSDLDFIHDDEDSSDHDRFFSDDSDSSNDNRDTDDSEADYVHEDDPDDISTDDMSESDSSPHKKS